MSTKYTSSLVYGFNDEDFVVIGSNTYNYGGNINIINIIKEYKKIQFDNNFNANIDWIPEGVIELRFGEMFDKSLDTLPSSVKIIIIKKYNEIGFTSFNKSLDNLPHGLEILELHYNNKFNQLLNNLPYGLKTLFLNCTKHKCSVNNLPDSLENIYIKHINNNIYKLPNNLKKFNRLIYDGFRHNQECIDVYNTFKLLTIQYPNIQFMYNNECAFNINDII